MMLSGRERSAVLVFVAMLLAVLAISMPVQGADDDVSELLEDFVHYTNIARPDFAAANAQRALDSGLSDAELALALDGQGRDAVRRFDEATSKAQFIASLADVSSTLAQRVEQGRLDLARDPARIEEAIQSLVGTERGRRLAEKRLEAAGEYAMPALVQTMINSDNETLKARVRDMIVRIGRRAVTPLCVLLANVDDQTQRIVCDMLGEIGYAHAAPVLKQVAEGEGEAGFVRDAAMRSLSRIGAPSGSVSELYAWVGHQYFDEATSLVAYPGDEQNNVWAYDSFVELVPTAVATEIYCEIMAMKMAAAALSADETDAAALSLFVAANLRRENEMPAEMGDPIYGNLDYTPNFYATVFGTSTCLDVLSMGLDRMDTTLVRDAIGALAQTTGGSNLFAGSDGRRPLVEALLYPDRRTQYEAALVLGRALPSERFDRDFAVVTTLASAVRTSNRSYATIIADSQEDVGVYAARLSEQGFEIGASGLNVSEVRQQFDAIVGVDVVLMSADNAEEAKERYASIRALPKSAAAPVLMMVTGNELSKVRRAYRSDSKVGVVSVQASDEGFAAALQHLMQRAAGGQVTEVEAMEYAMASIETLRDIAISKNAVYDLKDAETALIDALTSSTGGMQIFVADVLCLIDSEDSQVALLDAAFAASGRDRNDLLDRVAISVKRMGNMAHSRHVAALVDLIASASGETAEAAARVHGAMNLPTSAAIGLIPH